MKRRRIDIGAFDKILPSERFSANDEDLVCYGYDASGVYARPAAVFWPVNTGEVSDIMYAAYTNGVNVVPRGAGSGMTGGSVPLDNAVVISFERMNRILEINTANRSVLVQPGVINGQLQKELNKIGYFYPPDPASMQFCTIGGNVAENAGGPSALKYGVTRDYVMSIEAVLSDGRIINTGVKTAKGVVGYDLTRLLTGSEGTLAIFTKIRLRILPLPEQSITMLALFQNIVEAGTTISNIMASGILPRTLEIMDSTTIRAVNSYKKTTIPDDVDAALLIELDGSPDAIKQEALYITKICQEYGAEVMVADSVMEREDLWSARRSISPALYRISPHKINEDIVVPIDRMSEMLLRLRTISKLSGIGICSFGHAGDGNIHVNILTDKNSKEEYAEAEKLVKEIFIATLELGGTISGEHGIGLTKSKYIGMEIEADVLDLMQGVKKLMDHKNILNPGKVFATDAIAEKETKKHTWPRPPWSIRL